MSKMLTETQVLKKLNIPDFRHLSKDNVMSFVSMIDKMDPEVAKKALEQLPDFAKVSIQGLNDLKDTVSKVMDDDKESADRFYDMCDTIIDAIKLAMSDGVVTFEEKKYCIDKMQEIARMASEKDSEGKKFKWSLVANFALTTVTVLATAVTLLGGAANIELPFKKNYQAHKEEMGKSNWACCIYEVNLRRLFRLRLLVQIKVHPCIAHTSLLLLRRILALPDMLLVVIFGEPTHDQTPNLHRCFQLG